MPLADRPASGPPLWTESAVGASPAYQGAHFAPDAGGLPAAAGPYPPTPLPSRPARRRIVLVAAIGAGALVVLVASVALALALRTPTTTVTGELVLSDYDTAESGCAGTGGYDDITYGATVILKNQDGKILGSGALDSGVPDTSSGTCTYRFSIPDVSENETQYAVEVTHRGQVVDSRAELTANDWHFALTLGD